MLQEAAEHEVQKNFNVLLDEDFCQTQDDCIKLVQLLGECRGMRRPFQFLQITIKQLAEEVEADRQSAESTEPATTKNGPVMAEHPETHET